MRNFICLLICLLFTGSALAAVEIHGVSFDQRRQVIDTELRLNGAAVLNWAVFFDVYAGALYLPEGQPGSRWTEDVPKLLEISYLRNFAAEDFVETSDQLLRKNLSEEKYRLLEVRLGNFYRLFRDIEKGDRYSLVYHPAIGTQLRLNGEPLGSVAGHDFAIAYFGLWLGRQPISEGFRDRLLGS